MYECFFCIVKVIKSFSITWNKNPEVIVCIYKDTKIQKFSGKFSVYEVVSINNFKGFRINFLKYAKSVYYPVIAIVIFCDGRNIIGIKGGTIGRSMEYPSYFAANFVSFVDSRTRTDNPNITTSILC